MKNNLASQNKFEFRYAKRKQSFQIKLYPMKIKLLGPKLEKLKARQL